MLLVSSYIFYIYWRWDYAALIVISTLVDYIAAKKIYKSNSIRRRKIWLVLSLSTNLGLLIIFKYLSFFAQIITSFTHINIDYNLEQSGLLLPIGISFYTFQTISYTLDIYRGKNTPEKHLGKFALYVSFFPQLLAGPIERANRLLPQLEKLRSLEISVFISGVKRIILGLFKKVVIADNIGLLVDSVYNTSIDQNGFALLIATILFGFQIYYDFSGYCDIAIGVANLFGVKLSENFRLPYNSRSISEFWTRWHITLSSWFKDYLYISLGGNKVIRSKWFLNIILVFLLSGLWHGAGWNFVVWGLLHGMYYLVGKITLNNRRKVYKEKLSHSISWINSSLEIITVFSLVTLAWVMFRSESLSQAIRIYSTIISEISNIGMLIFSSPTNIIEKLGWLSFSNMEIIIYISILVSFTIIDSIGWIDSYISENVERISLRSIFILDVMVLCLVMFGDLSNRQFIYFQF